MNTQVVKHKARREYSDPMGGQYNQYILYPTPLQNIKAGFLAFCLGTFQATLCKSIGDWLVIFG